MNRTQKFLYCLALVLGIVLFCTGQPIAGFVLFTAVAVMVSPIKRAWCCDNALGTLATATIVQEALALVFAKRPVLNRVSTGFTDVNGSPIAQFGQSVITRTLGVPAVGNFGDAAANRADVDVPVALNQFKQLRYDFTPQQYSGTNRDLIRESAEPMAVAMANYMVDAVGALWTPANFPARTGADAIANGAVNTKTVLGAGWDYTHLVNTRMTLNKAGVPDFKRYYVGNSDVYGSMLNDLRIVAALNNPNNMGAIEKGELPEVSGLGLQEYPNLTAKAGNNLVGVAGTPDSVVYAQRVPRDPRDVPGFAGIPIPGRIGIVTEPRTGLSVMVVEFVALPSLNITTMLIWMYGVAVGNPNNAQLIVSQ
jgi:hypothetical protein